MMKMAVGLRGVSLQGRVFLLVGRLRGWRKCSNREPMLILLYFILPCAQLPVCFCGEYLVWILWPLLSCLGQDTVVHQETYQASAFPYQHRQPTRRNQASPMAESWKGYYLYIGGKRPSTEGNSKETLDSRDHPSTTLQAQWPAALILPVRHPEREITPKTPRYSTFNPYS